MKNIFKCLLAFSLLFAVGCDDVEPTMYNPASGTFLSFSSNVYTLPVVINDDGQVTITLNSSTASPVDRVYNLDIIEEDSNANPLTYTFPSTITIPANEYQGTIVVTGVDNGLVDSQQKQFVFRISNVTNESMDSNLVTVNVVEVCPFDAGVSFTGDYVVTQLSSGPIAGELLGNGTVVTLAADGEFTRTFESDIYPGAGPFGPFDFYINFSCGLTSLARNIDTGVGCANPVPRVNIQLEVADNQGTYTPSSDAVFTLRIKENRTGACNAPMAETVLRFTKQ